MNFLFAQLSAALIEYETLSGDEVDALFKGEKPNRDDPDETETPRPSSSVPTGGRGKPAGGFGDAAPQPG